MLPDHPKMRQVPKHRISGPHWISINLIFNGCQMCRGDVQHLNLAVVTVIFRTIMHSFVSRSMNPPTIAFVNKRMYTLCCNLCQCLNKLSNQSLETILQSWKTSLLSFDSMKQNSSSRKRNNSSVNHCKSSLNGTCKLFVGLPAMGHPHQLPPWATGIHNTT